MTVDILQYLRRDRLPHIWCPGCGNGIVLRSFVLALNKLGFSREETVIVSGIGCSSRAAGYLDFDTVHTTHGRALAFATGIKLARPHLKVFVIMGDGDSSAIGGNHLIHACRRNIDLTTVIFNNSIYGMTGGQVSPMTPSGKKATSAPFGTLDTQFNICRLAEAAGATFVGRATSYHSKMLTDIIVEGALNKGFSLIEAVTHCPTSYGRLNGLPKPIDLLNMQKKPDYPIGVLHRSEGPEFTEAYMEVIKSAREE